MFHPTTPTTPSLELQNTQTTSTYHTHLTPYIQIGTYLPTHYHYPSPISICRKWLNNPLVRSTISKCLLSLPKWIDAQITQALKHWYIQYMDKERDHTTWFAKLSSPPSTIFWPLHTFNTCMCMREANMWPMNNEQWATKWPIYI